MAEQVSYRRAMFLVTASSLMVPLIGLVTAPILAQSLGVGGRGAAGAALAPNLLIVGVATLGLPQALTYFLAKRPDLTRRSLLWTSGVTLLLGLMSLAVIFVLAPVLSDSEPKLERLILIGTLLALPGLLVNLLRGAAAGRQMWMAVAAERVSNSLLRLVALVGLAVVGRLDVTNALLVMAIAPVIAGAVYLGLLGRAPTGPDALEHVRLVPALLGYGVRVWLGSVAVTVIARLSQLLITPLSNVNQLGLYLVANTISDIPYIVTQTVRDVAFGTNSAESDTVRLQSTSRIATLIAFSGSLVIGATLPLWIGSVFGHGFEAAIMPTWILLLESVVAVPGLIAGAGVDSAGRPGLRSASLTIALALNVVGIIVLVPLLGASGAGIAALVGTTESAVFVLIAARRVLNTRMSLFVIPQRGDLQLIFEIGGALWRRVWRGRGGEGGRSNVDHPTSEEATGTVDDDHSTEER